MYLAGEKQNAQQKVKLANQTGNGDASSRPPNANTAAMVFELQGVSKRLSIDIADTTEDKLDAYNSWILGVAYRAEGRHSEAENCFRRAVRLQPYFWSAWCDFFKTHFGASIVTGTEYPLHFDAIIDMWSDENTDGQRINAQNSTRTKNALVTLSKTFETFKSQVEMQYSSHPAVCWVYVELLLMTNQYSKAFTFVTSQKQTAFSKPFALKRLAKCTFHLGRHAQSLRLSATLNKIDTYDMDLAVVNAMSLSVENRASDLAELALTCGRLAPSSPITCAVLGFLFIFNKKFSAAIEVFEKAVATASTCEFWLTLGMVCESQLKNNKSKDKPTGESSFLDFDDLHQKAKQAFTRAEALAPWDYRAAFGLARLSSFDTPPQSPPTNSESCHHLRVGTLSSTAVIEVTNILDNDDDVQHGDDVQPVDDSTAAASTVTNTRRLGNDSDGHNGHFVFCHS